MNPFQIFISFADLVTYTLLGLEKGSRLAESVHFFFYDVTKILFLLVVVIYLIGLVRSSMDMEKIKHYLAGKNRFIAYFMASLFGSITPFCSCSSIPLFLGFTSARIPVGITMAFLITSPIVNEMAIVLLGSVLGIKFMLSYLAIGVGAGVIGGMFFDAIGAEKYLTPLAKPEARLPMAGAPLPMAGGGCGTTQPAPPTRSLSPWQKRHQFAKEETLTIVGRIWKWVIVGISAGALFHGFVPAEWVQQTLGSAAWWTVPLASIVGIPLYADATSIIPIAESMLAKGVPVGTMLTFMMSVVGASFPEFIILKQVMQVRMLALLFALLLVIFTLTGWLMNGLSGWYGM